MKQNEIRKRSLSPLDTGYARLLCVYSLARGALALWALIVLGNFAAGRLKLQNPLGRLSAFPKVYVVLALGAAGFCGLLLIVYVLSALISPFCAAKKPFAVRAGRFMAVLLAAMDLCLCLGIEIGGTYAVNRFAGTAVVSDEDVRSIRLLMQIASIGLLAAVVCKIGVFRALRGAASGKGKAGRCVLPLVSALFGAVFLSASALYLYCRFDASGTVFSYTLTQLLPFTLDRNSLTYVLDAALIVASKSLLIAGACAMALVYRKTKPKTGFGFVSSILTAICALSLYFLLCEHMKDFCTVMSRYSLYSKYLSRLTLIKHPACAGLCLMLLAALMIKPAGRNVLITVGALLMAGFRAFILISERPYVTLRSFNAAFETAMPFVYVAAWALMALTALAAAIVKLAAKRPLPFAVRLTAMLILLVPLGLAAAYYAENLKFMLERTSAIAVAQTFCAQYLLPSLAPALLAFSAGRRD